MMLDMKFEESNQRIDLTFEEVQQASDGGFERGYEEGFSKGNKEGYKEGYEVASEEIAPKFGISNEVTGTGIATCDYVNENEHNVEVKLSSDNITDFSGIEVKCVGKNLFDESKLSNGEFVEFNGVRCYKYIDSGKQIISYDGIFDLNSQYTIAIRIYRESGNETKITNILAEYTDGSQSYNIQCKPNEITIFTSPIGKTIKRIRSCASYNTTTYLDLSIMQIEKGSIATDYESYTETTYLANADGTVDGITSISPIMNLICDTEGVDIFAKYYCANDVEYHRYWDEYQTFGTRTNYDCAFAGYGWTDETFNPKYPLIIGTAYMMFRYAKITDAITKDYVFDFSQASSCDYVFLSVLVKQLNIIGVEGTRLDTMFQDMRALETLNYTGTIGKTSVRLQWSSNLNVECAKNIIRSLINYKGTNYDMSYQISFHANVWALLDAEGNASPNGDTWKNYINYIGWSYS